MPRKRYLPTQNELVRPRRRRRKARSGVPKRMRSDAAVFGASTPQPPLEGGDRLLYARGLVCASCNAGIWCGDADHLAFD